MRIAIVRRALGVTFSMDVYADGLISGLKSARPDWEIIELYPKPWWKPGSSPWQGGSALQKYYERFWNHPRAVSQVEADIFHIVDHTNGHVAYWLKKRKKPVVITCHDLVQLIYPEILQDQSRFPAFSMVAWKYSVRGMFAAQHIISVSENTKKDIPKFLAIKPDKITAIPNAVGADCRPLQLPEPSSIRQQYSTNSDHICLLNVGSTHQRKNIPGILKTLYELRSRGFNAILWRVGEKFTQTQSDFIKAHDLEANIVHLGTPDRSKLIEIYNAADMLIAPSLYEGFGLTVLEAMACGLPVITSNMSSLPEVVGDGAILVDPTDANQIADAVISIYKDTAMAKELVNSSLERAKMFTWANCGEQVAQVYEKLLHA